MELLREPRLAQLYTYFLQQGPISVEQSIEEVGISRSTVYEDVNRLAELGVLTKDETVEPIEMSVDPIHLWIKTEHGTYEVSPVLIDVVGRTHRRENEDISTFVELSYEDALTDE
jgi:DNA-binding Lrp family transcriptional regulator